MSYTEDSIKLPNLKHFTIQYNKQYMTKPILILFWLNISKEFPNNFIHRLGNIWISSMNLFWSI